MRRRVGLVWTDCCRQQPPGHAGSSFADFFLLPWKWKRYVPPKHRFTQYLHVATSQKTEFFITDISFTFGFQGKTDKATNTTPPRQLRTWERRGKAGLKSSRINCFELTRNCMNKILDTIVKVSRVSEGQPARHSNSSYRKHRPFEWTTCVI
jgi:hypothetical protein